MISFFFFALGGVVGYWVRGTKIVTWVNKQLDSIKE